MIVIEKIEPKIIYVLHIMIDKYLPFI